MNAPTAVEDVSLYVHVPFCASKCAYCDFLSSSADPADPACASVFDAFCDAVMAAVQAHERAGLLACVPTIYVGGGTPTLLGARLPTLVRELRALPGVPKDAEVSVEANPDSLDAALVAELCAAGVTRVSLGVQSFDDDVLTWLGRPYTASRARAAANLLSDAGMSFSVDLMCGVPVQSNASWERTVESAIATGAQHVSVYPLSVEDGTPLSLSIEAGEVPDTDADTAAEQMVLAAIALRAAGLERYEVASYARSGHECRHNLRYWTGGAYLGVGPAAASMLPAPPDGARVRFTTHADIEAFLEAPTSVTPSAEEVLGPEATLREDAMLGLRLTRGITASDADAAGVTAVLEELAREGLVERAISDTPGPASDRWRTTERGWLLGNEVFGRVWWHSL